MFATMAYCKSNITIELMFTGVNMLLAELQARSKMSSEKGQNHIYAQEHQFYCYCNNFRGHFDKESKTDNSILKTANIKSAFVSD